MIHFVQLLNSNGNIRWKLFDAVECKQPRNVVFPSKHWGTCTKNRSSHRCTWLNKYWFLEVFVCFSCNEHNYLLKTKAQLMISQECSMLRSIRGNTNICIRLQINYSDVIHGQIKHAPKTINLNEWKCCQMNEAPFRQSYSNQVFSIFELEFNWNRWKQLMLLWNSMNFNTWCYQFKSYHRYLTIDMKACNIIDRIPVEH